MHESCCFMCLSRQLWFKLSHFINLTCIRFKIIHAASHCLMTHSGIISYQNDPHDIIINLSSFMPSVVRAIGHEFSYSMYYYCTSNSIILLN